MYSQNWCTTVHSKVLLNTLNYSNKSLLYNSNNTDNDLDLTMLLRRPCTNHIQRWRQDSHKNLRWRDLQPEFPKWSRLVGDNLGKMAKNCTKITKSTFLEQNDGRRIEGISRILQVPPTRGNLATIINGFYEKVTIFDIYGGPEYTSGCW